MHIMGGFAWAYLFLNINNYFNFKLKLKHILFLVLFIAVTWEAYELIMGLTNLSITDLRHGLPDTVKDIIDGLLGGFLACKIFYSHKDVSKKP